MTKRSASLTAFFFLFYTLSAAFIGYVTGAAVMQFDLPTSKFLSNALRGGEALEEKLADDKEGEKPTIAEKDVIKVASAPVPEAAYKGYTLFSSLMGKSIQLIDMDGNVVHEWSRPFDETWKTLGKLPLGLDAKEVYMHDSLVFPNGDILVNYHSMEDTPYGLGIVKLDKDSNILWRYDGQVHHEFTMDKAGNIYAITHEILMEEQLGEELAFVPTPSLADFLVILSPDGKEQKKILMFDAFMGTPYEQLLYNDAAMNYPKGDFMHCNSVSVVSKEVAAKSPLFEEGDALVSVRNMDTVAVVRPSTGKVVWAMRGAWKMQHSARILENGNILLFDNQGFRISKEKRYSRIVEVNPVTQEYVWSYAGSKEKPFLSNYRGSVSRLPNGNTLIVESAQQHIFEVSPSGRTVWQYRWKSEKPGRTPLLLSAKRYGPDELTFLKAK